MNKMTEQELLVLQYLLAKVENRHIVMGILIDVILNKYNHNKTHAAKALGYSLRSLRSFCNNFQHQTIQ